MYEEIICLIKEASKNEPKSTDQLFLKLMEELGEATQAFLASNNVSGNDYKQMDDGNVKEELVDILLVNLDILFKLGIADTEFKNLLNSKIKKWSKNQNH